MNFWTNWYSVRNVLEYYFWFRSRLHFHAAAGLHPARRQHRVHPHADVLRADERLGRRAAWPRTATSACG